MIEVHYGVVRAGGRWTVIGDGLRLKSYDTEAEAERAARRMADQVVVLPVHLDLPGALVEFRPEPRRLNAGLEDSLRRCLAC